MTLSSMSVLSVASAFLTVLAPSAVGSVGTFYNIVCVALGTVCYVGNIGIGGTLRYWQSASLAVWVVGTDGNIDYRYSECQ